MKRTLGVCYYPEHWSESIWKKDALQMKASGLTYVRIGEFAWSELEPREGESNFDWLDEAIGILGEAGLQVVLGTPTATPPIWMVKKYPDMLAVDAEGRPRKFGSRRHYCFSHEGYRHECARMVTRLAKRYGTNRYLAAWQTDNEFGCHDTTHSYSGAARSAFQHWLRRQYGNEIEQLNEAWGNVFWSMRYTDFAEIELPNLTVTEPNPAHVLCFRRFSSDQVVDFNRMQVEIIRAHSKLPITHNFMGRITDFDHFAVGKDLEIASWDSYPLGFLEDRIHAPSEHKRRFARQGDPDFQAFHHDLYRAVGKDRMWIMEQQPGPVNWAPHNPAPAPGMVRLWTWEAFAHGAETVCFFRWRQLPFAQEQMHSGLLRPDHKEARGLIEAQQVAGEILDAPDVSIGKAPVALMFDYDADFAWATQPHGRDLSYFDLVLDLYRALRKLGLSIDFVSPETENLDSYKLVMIPGLVHIPDKLRSRICRSKTLVVLGPRTGARDWNMQIPVPLPPSIPKLDCAVDRVETLREDMLIDLVKGGAVKGYREFLDCKCTVVERTVDNEPLLLRSGNLYYLGGWLDQQAAGRILKTILSEAEVETMELPAGVRIRETATERFWFNYDSEAQEVGEYKLAPFSVTRENR